MEVQNVYFLNVLRSRTYITDLTDLTYLTNVSNATWQIALLTRCLRVRTVRCNAHLTKCNSTGACLIRKSYTLHLTEITHFTVL
jgi:hypothetical protein